MINEDTQAVDLDNTTEDTTEDTQDDTETEEQGVEYWKAEALKNKAILERNKGKKVETKEETKSDSFGLDVKGYLKASGIKSNEFDFVRAELKKSGGDIDALLENEYFQARLEKHREIEKTTDATPKGKRSGGVATDSVEYWMAKPIEDVPQEMRIKVVNAKLAKEQNKGIFYNS